MTTPYFFIMMTTVVAICIIHGVKGGIPAAYGAALDVILITAIPVSYGLEWQWLEAVGVGALAHYTVSTLSARIHTFVHGESEDDSELP